jgi:hypothetical protein
MLIYQKTDILHYQYNDSALHYYSIMNQYADAHRRCRALRGVAVQ